MKPRHEPEALHHLGDDLVKDPTTYEYLTEIGQKSDEILNIGSDGNTKASRDAAWGLYDQSGRRSGYSCCNG